MNSAPPSSPPAAPGGDERQILGIRFFIGAVEGAIERALTRGGLVVAPSAPNLLDLVLDPGSREALTAADLALTDSGLMCLMWRALTGEAIPRVSGYLYIKRLLEEPRLREPGAVFWVMPSDAARERTVAWLHTEGFPTSDDDCYVAPVYGKVVEDPALLERIKARQPAQIVIALGAGKQEKLGLYLRDRAGYRPAIHCIGAAIAFLTGDQAPIPWWADRLYLGWLMRIFAKPGLYLPRYSRAARVIPLMIRYRSALPPPAY